MGRLIDADEYCAKHCVRNCSESQRSACSLGTIPTAYDVEAVLNELENMRAKPAELVYDVPLIENIIEIVKKGGVK